MTVDASSSGVVFGNGTAASLANGVNVEAEGAVSNGILTATRVEIKTQTRGGPSRTFELHGAITSVNATVQSFVLRGTTVVWNGTTRFDNGTEANLVAGAAVEVNGTS